ncbi:carbohydrate ABC transporter permease [Leifsonia sp. H3M29-4]|uniref:carbohydrate ABC transporter permease n=1 Tax=Salinibacterium metalliresistens TaxID=3031321 RepID=UPI0023DC2062|nr:carbohydrate ABC transporter permease [Salinibacterium metalliresistens]MDF1477984.1 carbohydrate ABC transporter permease [Salinibacterium metalliresistens]
MTALTYRSRRRRRTPAAIGWSTLKGVVLAAACAVVLIPFVMVISTSLADPQQVNAAGGFVLWPEHPSFAAYEAILSGGTVTRAVLVSIGVTLVGTAVSLACTTTLAYALARPGSFAHKPLLLIVLFTLLFSPGMIPTYLVVAQLGLIDSWWSLILPVAVNAFNVIIMRAFFLDLPQDLFESARLDGAGEVRIFLRIVLPLSGAVIAVVGLFYAVAYWNNFFNALLYLNDTAMWPLQLILRTYVINGSPLGGDALGAGGEATQLPQQSLQMAILVLSIVPILLVYPFLQRHFAKGVLVGAVKG